MNRTNEHPAIQYFKLLWEYHRESFVDFVVAILLIVAASMSNRQLAPLEIAALVILLGYLAYALFDAFRTYKATSSNVHSGYSICLDKPINQYHDAIRNQVSMLTNWNVVTKHFRILDFDWQYYDGSKSPPTSWQNNIADISKHFFRYARRLPRHANLDIFLIAPSAIALGIGHTIGRNRNWNVYQYLTTDDSYILLPKVKNHNKADLTYIIMEDLSKEDCTDVTIILSFTKFLEDNFPDLTKNLIKVKYKFPERRIRSEHFYGVAEEISLVISTQVRLGKRVQLHLSMPSTLAFILGSRLEENSPISIYNRNYDGTWEMVFSLNQL